MSTSIDVGKAEVTVKKELGGVRLHVSVPSGKSAHLKVEWGDYTVDSGLVPSVNYVMMVVGTAIKRSISKDGKSEVDLPSDSKVEIYPVPTGSNGRATGHCKVTVSYSGGQQPPAAQTYTVRFNKNDGSGATATQTFDRGVAQNLKRVDSQLGWNRSDYTFKGWATSSYGSVSYADGQSVKDLASAGATLNLYAVWQYSPQPVVKKWVEVCFRMQNPVVYCEPFYVSFLVGGKFADGDFPAASAEGYIFKGWQTRDGVFVDERTTVSETMTTLYGVWSKKEVEIPKPDLKPYTPSGWSGSLVVSTSSTSMTESLRFSSDDVVYVSWAVVCRNGSAGMFGVALEIDGARKTTWSNDGLNVGYYTYFDAYSIGRLSPGSHVIRVVVDSENDVSETDEGNNVMSRSIVVVDASPPVPSTTEAPLNFNAEASPDGRSVKLTWDYPTVRGPDDVYIYRSATRTRPSMTIGGTPCWFFQFEHFDYDVIQGQTYYYWISAKDDDKSMSSYVGPVSVTVSRPSYGIAFASNGGMGTIPRQTVEFGRVFKLPSGTTLAPPSGKSRFAGWACSNGRRYDDETLVFDLGNVTMTAIWE